MVQEIQEFTTRKASLIQRVQGGGVFQGRARKCGKTFFHIFWLFVTCTLASGTQQLPVSL